MAKIFQLIASSGQSVPTDAVAGQTLALTGGTVTLVNDGTYGYLWRLVGGYLENSALTGQGTYGEGYPLTIAFRFRVSNRQTGYSRWAIYGSGPSDGLQIGNNNIGGAAAAAFRCCAMVGGSVPSGLGTTSKTYTAGNVLTVVMRANFGTSDLLNVWYQTTGRVGSSADSALSGAFSFGASARDTLRLTAAANETLDILDYAAWNELLTDAQCAALADDIRAALGGGSSNGTAGGATMAASSSLVAGTASGASVATAGGATMAASSSLVAGTASGASVATAGGATMAATASLLSGSATGAISATAAGATMSVTSSLLPGSASASGVGTLQFQAAGLEFGARTGLGIDTFAIDTGVLYRYTVHADGLLLGSAIYTSAAIALDSAGKLPNVSNAAFTQGVTYRIVAVRQSDGEAATFRMVAA